MSKTFYVTITLDFLAMPYHNRKIWAWKGFVKLGIGEHGQQGCGIFAITVLVHFSVSLLEIQLL